MKDVHDLAPASSARRSNTPSIARRQMPPPLSYCCSAMSRSCSQSFEGLYHLLGRFAERLEMDFGLFRRFVGRIDAGEVLDLAAQRPARRGPSGRAWRIPRTACRRTPRRTRPRAISSRAMRALGAERRDEGDEHDQPGIGHQPRHFGDAADVLDAVGLGEAEIAVEAVADIVAVEDVGVAARGDAASSRAGWRWSTCPSRTGR